MPERSIKKTIAQAILNLNLPKESKILDLSCGDGEIIEMLAKKGYRVEGTHFRQDDYIFRNPSPILQAATIHKGIDLTKPLPFADESYDIVLATEVLEHLPAHVPVIEEVDRILVRGGLFVFSTPNIHRISSRFQFLLTGAHDLCGARLGWHVSKDDLYSTHMNPVYFPVLHSILHQNHMRIKQLRHSSIGPLSLLALIPCYPVFAVASTLEARHFMKRSPEGGKDLLCHMLDPHLLLSKQLIGLAEKFDG